MDLMYYESPPGLQFLHFMRNSVSGGSSIFVDSFRAASMIRLTDAYGFKQLTRSPVSFHYVNDDRHYYFTRPTIVVREDHPNLPIDHVNYAPPFQAPFDIDTIGDRPNWKRFMKAFRQFAENVERPEMKYEETLKAGEAVVFANRRVLHARRAFDTSEGERWLKGTYVDWDDFQVRKTFEIIDMVRISCG
jgi:gamma-butyrobetaine dioxygenase